MSTPLTLVYQEDDSEEEEEDDDEDEESEDEEDEEETKPPPKKQQVALCVLSIMCIAVNLLVLVSFCQRVLYMCVAVWELESLTCLHSHLRSCVCMFSTFKVTIICRYTYLCDFGLKHTLCVLIAICMWKR